MGGIDLRLGVVLHHVQRVPQGRSMLPVPRLHPAEGSGGGLAAFVAQMTISFVKKTLKKPKNKTPPYSWQGWRPGCACWSGGGSAAYADSARQQPQGTFVVCPQGWRLQQSQTPKLWSLRLAERAYVRTGGCGHVHIYNLQALCVGDAELQQVGMHPSTQPRCQHSSEKASSTTAVLPQQAV